MSPENKKRVGLFVDSLMGGGAERVALNFAEKFIELGHEARVFVLHPPIEHQTGNVPIHLVSDRFKLANWRPLNKWLYAQRIKKLVREIEADGKPFDFFISNAEDSDRLTRMAGLRPVFIRYRNSLQHFLAAKVGDTTGLKRRIRHARWLNKFRRFYSGHIVTVSRALEEELVHEIGLKPKSIKTIYNPFDFDLLRRRVARDLIGHQHGQLAQQGAEGGAAGVLVAHQGQLVLHQRVGDVVDFGGHRQSLLKR